MRQGQYARDQISLAMDFIGDALVETASSKSLFTRAAVVSLDLEHPIYDCIYLALAERKGWPLATADQKLADAAARLGTVKVQFVLS